VKVQESLVLLSLSAVGCSGPTHKLGLEEYSNLKGTEALEGYGCVPTDEQAIAAGGASAPLAGDPGGPLPAYSFLYTGTGAAVHFVVQDGEGQTLAERRYDIEFLDGDKRDEVIVDVGPLHVRFEHWGEQNCSSPPAGTDANFVGWH